MQTRTVELDTPDGPMALYEAVPDTARAAIVVVQEAFGVNEHIEDVTRRFAGEGYHAVAPHLFHRTGGGTADYSDFAAVMPMMGALSDDAILTDIDAALAHLAQAGFAAGATGIVGFCMGGRVTFLTAARRALGAGVGFYGGGIVTSRFGNFPSLVGEAGSLKAPWLGLFGDQDQSIPNDDVDALRKALADAPVATDVVLYEGAEHGFFCDKRPSYHAEAAADAWRRTLEWFSTHLPG